MGLGEQQETPGEDARGVPDRYREGRLHDLLAGGAGPGTVFEPGEKITFAGITDGTSNTIGVIEAGPAVAWTKPGGIAYDPKKPFPKLDGPFSDVFMVGIMDGSALAIKPDIKTEVFRKLVERGDGSVVDFGDAGPT